jgi:hypothetical protein
MAGTDAGHCVGRRSRRRAGLLTGDAVIDGNRRQNRRGRSLNPGRATRSTRQRRLEVRRLRFHVISARRFRASPTRAKQKRPWSHFFARLQKEKFDPAWESHYLVYPGALSLPRVLADMTALVAARSRHVLFTGHAAQIELTLHGA